MRKKKKKFVFAINAKYGERRRIEVEAEEEEGGEDGKTN
jgi:hypothetical protein